MRSSPPERLATLRCLVGLYATFYVLARTPHVWACQKMNSTYYSPVGVLSWTLHPWPSSLTALVLSATCIGAVAFTLGWKYRITAPILASLLLVTLTYSNSWGKILHTENLLVFHVAILSLSRAGDVLSWDALGNPHRPSSSQMYAWPIFMMMTICVGVYFLAAIAKLRNSGLEFLDGVTLRNYIAFDNVRKLELGSIHSPLGVWLLDVPQFFQGLAWVSLLLEVGGPLALAWAPLRAPWAIAVYGFHVGVVALMAIMFPYQVSGVAFACFFRVEKLATTCGRIPLISKTLRVLRESHLARVIQ